MVKLVVKIGLSALLLWLLVRSFDTSAFFEQLFSISPWGPAAAGVILLILSMLQAWRWTWVFRALGEKLSFRKSWEIALIGLFFNQTLPSSVGGDAVRVWRAYRAGYGLATAAHSVILDRLAALAALLLLAAVSLPVLFKLIGDETARWSVVALIAAGFAGYAALLVGDRLPIPLKRFRITRALSQLSADSRRLFLRIGRGVPVLLISICIHICVALVVLLLARAMNIAVDALACLVLVPPVILVSMAPISIAGWGVREGAMVVAFGFVGVSPDAAFALSVMFGLVVAVVGLPGGVVWLVTGRREPRQVRLSEIAANLLKARNGRAS